MVVSDAFLTETARLADVVLPAALWGEKTGTFTNVDRTVHLSEQAVEPPGEARPDLDIFLDYARRMDLRDKDGEPLVKWSTPEECFEAWKECTRGRPCDYTGLSYDKLRGGSGIQWPCNDEAPGRHRAALRRPAVPDTRPLRGLRARPGDRRDASPQADFKAHGRRKDAPSSRQPNGRRRTNGPATSTRSRSPPAAPSTTSTPGRRPAARPSYRPPRPTPGSSCARATPSGSASTKGDLVRVSSPRGSVEAPARSARYPRRRRLHPVPLRLLGPRRGRRARRPPPRRQRADDDHLGSGLQAAAAENGRREHRAGRMKLGQVLTHLRQLEDGLADSLRSAADRHSDDHDVFHQCRTFAAKATTRAAKLDRVLERYGGESAWASAVSGESDELLEDLRSLHLRIQEVAITWQMAAQAAKAARDKDLLALSTASHSEVGDASKVVPDPHQVFRATGARRPMTSRNAARNLRTAFRTLNGHPQSAPTTITSMRAWRPPTRPASRVRACARARDRKWWAFGTAARQLAVPVRSATRGRWRPSPPDAARPS